MLATIKTFIVTHKLITAAVTLMAIGMVGGVVGITSGLLVVEPEAYTQTSQEITQTQKEISDAEAETVELEEQITEKETQIAAIYADPEIAQLKAELDDKAEQLAVAETEYLDYKAYLADLEKTVAVKNDLMPYYDEYTALKRVWEAKQAEYDQVLAQLDDIAGEAVELEAEIAEIEVTKQTLKDLLDQRQAKLSELEQALLDSRHWTQVITDSI